MNYEKETVVFLKFRSTDVGILRHIPTREHPKRTSALDGDWGGGSGKLGLQRAKICGLGGGDLELVKLCVLSGQNSGYVNSYLLALLASVL